MSAGPEADISQRGRAPLKTQKKHEPGLSITSETSRCQWRGESMDYSQAIEAIQLLQRKAMDVAAAPATSTIAP